MLTFLGGFAGRVVGLVPWAGPRTTLALLYALLVIVMVGGPSGAVYIHMRAKMAVAEESINAQWEAKLAIAEKQYVEMANAAIVAAIEVDVVPSDGQQLDELCEQSPSCRDRAGPDRKPLPPDNMVKRGYAGDHPANSRP